MNVIAKSVTTASATRFRMYLANSDYLSLLLVKNVKAGKQSPTFT